MIIFHKLVRSRSAAFAIPFHKQTNKKKAIVTMPKKNSVWFDYLSVPLGSAFLGVTYSLKYLQLASLTGFSIYLCNFPSLHIFPNATLF